MVNSKVAGALVERPDGVHVKEIAKKVQLPEKKLARIMRTLSVRHIFREGMLTLTVFLCSMLYLDAQSLLTSSPITAFRVVSCPRSPYLR